MKILKFLKDKTNLIAFANDQVINNANIKINENQLYFKKTNDYFLFLDNYDKYGDLYLNFESNTDVSLFLLSYNSRKMRINYHFNLQDKTNLKIYTSFVSRRKTDLDVERIFTLDGLSKLEILNSVTYNGKLKLEDIVNLNSVGANVDLDLLNVGGSDSVYKIFQNINHNAKNTLSNINNWIIAEDKAKMNYSVTGSIAKGNEFSNCMQNNKGIMLSDESEIIVEPKLFIDEYNVSASHGAAIGQIDELQLYYLLSRGLTENEARSLIISGYTNPFIAKINDEDIQNVLIKSIAKLIRRRLLNE